MAAAEPLETPVKRLIRMRADLAALDHKLQRQTLDPEYRRRLMRMRADRAEGIRLLSKY